jgi:transposase
MVIDQANIDHVIDQANIDHVIDQAIVDEFQDFSRNELIVLLVKQGQVIVALEQRVSELESQQGGQPPADASSSDKPSSPASATPPSWVRANTRRKQEKQERKKRAQSFARGLETPTQECFHAASCCPDCGRTLHGGSEHRRRQIIDLPETPVQVTDHVIVGRWCGVCKKRVLPQVDLSGQALGQHRIGVRLMSLVCSLKTALRLPVRQITQLLHSLWGVKISAGEVCELLHDAAAQGKPVYEAIQKQVRGSPFVHADETGWREDGQNGYLWSFSTPTVRYFVYNQSRSGSVPLEVLGSEFGGIVVCDFYGGYNHVGVGVNPYDRTQERVKFC